MKPLTLAATVMLTTATAAQAAPSRITSDGFSRQSAANFANCVITMSPAAARRLLAMDYRTAAYDQAMHKLLRGNSRCVAPGATLRGAPLLFAGALAETFLLQDVVGTLGGALRFDPARPALLSRSESETTALCIVRKSPDAVAHLVSTPPGSPAEKAAVAPVVAQLPSCLAQNVSMKLNVPALRAITALAAYRVAATNGAVRGVSVSGASR